MFHKPMNPEDCQKKIGQVGQKIDSIFQKSDKKFTNFQLSYDNIFQLCREDKQEQILSLLNKKIEQYVPESSKSVDMESQQYLQRFTAYLKEIQTKLKSIVSFCLYLDLNYCKDLNIKLLDKLNSVFFKNLLKQEQIMKKLGIQIAKSQIKNELMPITSFLQELHLIDQNNQYFSNSFIPYYCPILIEHYKKICSESFAQKQIGQYIQWAKAELLFQKQFLLANFKSKKSTANINFIMKELYNIIVTQFKQQIYSKNQIKLFENLTCEMLELYTYGLNKDIELHAEWYNGMIIKKLNLISTSNNQIFIESICKFYKQIMEILQTTYNKFDIHYRSRFAFEQWINVEKLQIPQRLNDYINKKCLQKEDTTKFTDVMEYVSIIFVLMKEKYLFEKLFRRSLINRVIKFDYVPKHDIEIIANMEKECSQEFVKNISPIIKSYEDMRIKYEAAGQALMKTIVINMENWPFQQKNQSVALHKSLIALTQPFTDSFIQNNKDKSLYWHPNVGTMIIVVHFSKDNSKQLIVDTCMGNLLLPFNEKKGYKLKDFCCESGYKLDQIYDSLRKLIEAKVVLNQGTQQNYYLSLNEQFSSQQKSINLIETTNENEFQVKALSQLKADRKFMVQAIIIKIIKKLKITQRSQILIQTAPMIQKKGFSFNAQFVQKSIDRLIDKEFIRDHQDGKIGYIA